MRTEGTGANAQGRELALAPALALALSFFGCARAVVVPPTEPPLARAEEAPALPPIPERDGALQLDLVYPPEGAAVAARDSTFVFGSTGSGRAQLEINGVAVEVAPNGAFLAYLPVPPEGTYRLRATRGGEATTLERRVRVPAPAPLPSGVQIFAGTPYPTGAVALLRGELIEVGFRGTPGGRAFLRLPSGERVTLVEAGASAEFSDAANFQRAAAAGASAPIIATYRGVLDVQQSITTSDTSVARPVLGSLQQRTNGTRANGISSSSTPAEFELIVGNDTARRAVRLNLAVIEVGRSRVGVVQPPGDAPYDWTLRGRAAPSGPFHYFWPPGTRLELTGERNGMVRVRLAADLSAWAPLTDLRLLPEGGPLPRSGVDGARMTPRDGWIDVRIPLSQRLPFHVDQDERALHINVFGATSRINFFQQGSLDALIARAEWSQPADDVFRLTVHLTQPVWGYEPYFDASDALVVRIRRPPRIDPDRPLSGLLVALDAGHPPGGAIGPTRLTEAEANLWIARKLQPMLEAAGARVLMTRRDESAVDLNLRPRMARDSGAHVLVSVHNNAFPDGVNPFENNGTSVYYFQPHSADMARVFQAELVNALGLRDLGVGRADLALVRPTWMPSVLTETSFLMIPQQEAALRNESVQERIARAHLRALENFLRRRAAAASS